MAEPVAARADVVRKTLNVNVPIERAFAVFTEEMGSWWPATHHIGKQPFAAITVEQRIGGRWFERAADGNECEWGRVLAWEPPNRVAFSWHLQSDWKFDPNPGRASEVEIKFFAEGAGKTRVELEHRGLERHGEGWQQLRTAMDSPGGWSLVLEQFAKVAGEKSLV
jgi:uncharacterized protein YndB with AHSA1/START domain